MLLLQIKDLFFKTGAIWLTIAISGIWAVYYVVKPTTPVYSPQQTAAIVRLGKQLDDWVGAIELDRGKAVLLVFDRDPFGTVTDMVRTAFWRSDRFDLLDYTIHEKLRRKIHWTLPVVGSREKAMEMAQRSNARYAIWGRIHEFSDIKGSAALRLSVEVVDREIRGVVMSDEFNIVQDGPPILHKVFNGKAGKTQAVGIPVSLRLLIWGLFTILLPIISFPLARMMLQRESNLANLTLVGVYSGCSLLLAYFLLARNAGDWLGPAFMLVAFGLSLFYYWHMLTMFERKLM